MNAQECACRQAEHDNIARELLTALEQLVVAVHDVNQFQGPAKLNVAKVDAYTVIARARKVL